jgi:hypothetical protein
MFTAYVTILGSGQHSSDQERGVARALCAQVALRNWSVDEIQLIDHHIDVRGYRDSARRGIAGRQSL